MKKIKFSICIMTLAGSLLILVASCKKDIEETLALKRMFRPSTITVADGATQSKISWSASLFTTAGTVSYVVQVSRDSAEFSQIDYSDTTQDVSITITDKDVPVRSKLYARVKAFGVNGAEDSKWEVSEDFTLTGEQLFLNLPASDIGDLSVILHWISSPDFTKIVITPIGGGAPLETTLSPTDATAGVKQIAGLTPGTKYSVEIFKGTASKGILTFTTQRSITGDNLIHLENLTTKSSILIDTLPDIPNGSIVILKRGFTYSVTASYLFKQSVTIVSNIEPGVPDKAKIYLTNPAATGTSVSFGVAASTSIDSIVFRDVYMYTGNFAASYTFNISGACSVKKIKLDDCRAEFVRSFVRVQGTGPATITDLFINNCVVDSVRDFGVIGQGGSSYFTNITVTNSTFYKLIKFVNIQSGWTGGTNKITIRNCTFNDLPTGGADKTTPVNNYFMDFGSISISGGIAVENCIFGKTRSDYASPSSSSACGIRAGSLTPPLSTLGTYSTKDFVIFAGGFSTAPYDKTSTSLWVNPSPKPPVNPDFHFKDLDFIGKNTAGDPRWRP